ncbi:MAG TPA: 5-formyltetrahydrofolate cyclo-ligase [Holophaga sp.]|jgi:5-formyltetrahydrofolate cyclo-ligase|nr:5-formyltetrahydrofolate cyclo-ligase [Holophaga sp.]
MTPTKAELRGRFRALRDALPTDTHSVRSRAICAHIAAFCVSRRIRRIGAFWPYGSELDLRFLFEAHPHWTFFFPRISSTSPPRLLWGSDPLEHGLFGLMEPTLAHHTLPPVQLLIVPGLVFDAQGYRLGYGKGFYDALLDLLPPETLAMGAAFECQRFPHLPTDPQDLPVQGLFTESGLHRFATDPGERLT